MYFVQQILSAIPLWAYCEFLHSSYIFQLIQLDPICSELCLMLLFLGQIVQDPLVKCIISLYFFQL